VKEMDDFDRYINEQMKDPDFKKEWDENEARYQLMMMVLRARNEEQLTQSELAERTGLRQSNISRIENGQSMPSIATLAKIAQGLGKRLEIRFV
jgi:DNA-binding XRE family transcriptional regulator